MTRRPLIIALAALATLAGNWREVAAYHAPLFGAMWGSQGSAPGQFKLPLGIACDAGGSVYVADGYNDRIQKFTSTGVFVATWGTTGSGDGEFLTPGTIAVDGAGFVYVLELANARVQKFTSSGAYVTQWGAQGSGNGQLNAPTGITVSPAGEVYVCDSDNRRIQVFSDAGVYQRQWSTIIGKAFVPYGIAMASTGDVFVLMFEKFVGCRVFEFTSTGIYVTNWSAPSSGAQGITIDALDRLLITDIAMSRAWCCTTGGSKLGFWGAPGTGKGCFNYPDGVATHGDDVFVLDSNNNRVQRFSYTSSFAFHPYLTDVTWQKIGTSLRVQMGFDNPSTEAASLPFAGSLLPQIYGAFLPSLPAPIGEFSVPPLPPSSHFDIFADVPFDALPPTAPLLFAGDGPEPGGPCAPPEWSGGIDLVWSEDEATARSPWQRGEVLVGPGAGYSYIHVLTGCSPTTRYDWFLDGLTSGFAATLFEEDRVTPAPDLLPPGWHGFVGVTAEASVLPGTSCCLNLILRCDRDAARVEVCARTCPWSTTDVAPGALGQSTGILGISPNPVARATAIRFAVANEGRAKLELLDVAGRRLATLWDGVLPPGDHVQTWDGTGASGARLPAGTYFLRLRSHGGMDGRTIILTQ